MICGTTSRFSRRPNCIFPYYYYDYDYDYCDYYHYRYYYSNYDYRYHYYKQIVGKGPTFGPRRTRGFPQIGPNLGPERQGDLCNRAGEGQGHSQICPSYYS